MLSKELNMKLKEELKVPLGGFRGVFAGKAGGQQQGIRLRLRGTNDTQTFRSFIIVHKVRTI